MPKKADPEKAWPRLKRRRAKIESILTAEGLQGLAANPDRDQSEFELLAVASEIVVALVDAQIEIAGSLDQIVIELRRINGRK